MVCFANTGREVAATLDFVRECGLRWRVPIRWLEYRHDGKPEAVEVSYETASRKGDPFETLIRRKNHLPNPVARFCTDQLKATTMKRFVRNTLGWDRWTNVIGLRADEPGRALRAIDPEKQIETTATGRPKRVFWRNAVPLYHAGTTVEDVAAFWRAQPFDLRTAGPHQGNRDGCFLKSLGHIQRCMTDDPSGWRGGRRWKPWSLAVSPAPSAGSGTTASPTLTWPPPPLAKGRRGTRSSMTSPVATTGPARTDAGMEPRWRGRITETDRDRRLADF